MNQLSLLAPTAVRAGSFSPRPYQAKADSAVDAALREHRSTLVCHPTGAGKTVLFCLQAVKRGSALVLVHRDTLKEQAHAKLEAATGQRVEIEKAGMRAAEANYIIASVQSLHAKRLAEFKRRFPSIPFIIIDEAHRAIAKSYRQIVEAYPDAKVLGVTATPDRSDGIAMRHMFETVADEYSIIDATTDGWLTPLRFQPVHANVNLDGIKSKKGEYGTDFDQAALDSVIVQEASKIAESVHRAMEQSGTPDGRLIIFTPGVKTAHAGCEAMNALRPGSSAVVDGTMEDRFKRAVLKRHRDGELLYVFNCNVLTEGHDDPTLFGIVDASPTKSRLRAMQRWGRATRVGHVNVDSLSSPDERRQAIAGSAKPWATVFDLAFNSGSHDVVSPVDVLGGRDLPDNVKATARRILRARGGTAADAVAEAKDEEAGKAKRANAARRLAEATKVTLAAPRTIYDRLGLSFSKRSKLPTKPDEPATSRMIAWLNWKKIPVPNGCTMAQFRRLRSTNDKREAKGLVQLGGYEWLRKYGVDAWKMPVATAKRVRDAIIANGHKSLTRDQLAGYMESRQPGED